MARKKKNIHYLYKTTCNITGRYYIGMHSTNNLDDGYLGSGRRLRASIRKYGEENHTKEILEFFDTRELLIEAEIKAITPDMINDNNCMNLMGGGTGGFISEEHQRHRSQCANKKLNEKLKYNPEFKENFSKAVSYGVNQSYLNGRTGKNYYSWKGKNFSDEHKQNISNAKKGTGKGEVNSQYGTKWINNGKINKKIDRNEINKYIGKGWFLGKVDKISDELIVKIIKYHDEIKSWRKTSKNFSIPVATIRDRIKKYIET